MPATNADTIDLGAPKGQCLEVRARLTTDLDRVEVDDVESLGREREHRVVREVREEALRLVGVLGEGGFAIDAAVLAPEEPAARFERRRDRSAAPRADSARGTCSRQFIAKTASKDQPRSRERKSAGSETRPFARHASTMAGDASVQTTSETGIREELAVLTRPAPISSSRVAPAASSRARNASRSSCFQFSTGCRSRTSTFRVVRSSQPREHRFVRLAHSPSLARPGPAPRQRHR